MPTPVPIATIDFVKKSSEHCGCVGDTCVLYEKPTYDVIGKGWPMGSVTAVIALQPPWHINSIRMASTQYVRVLPVTDISKSQADDRD